MKNFIKATMFALAISGALASCGNKNDTSAADDVQSTPETSPINEAGDSTSHGIDSARISNDSVH